jgi:hypothetical protein
METTLKSNKITINKPRHKGGAPPKRIRREKGIRVRLTASEHFFISAKAKEAGMVLSSWFREAAKSAKVMSRLKPEDIKIMRTLAGLANNLNQLMRLAHKDGLLTVARKCNEVLTQIDEAINKFNSDDRQDT